jgi:hypothetical protein
MKKEKIEEAAERLQKDKYGIFISKDADVKGQLVIDTAKAAFLSGMKEGAKWQAERMYSEEDMEEAFTNGLNRSFDSDFDRWLGQFKKK